MEDFTLLPTTKLALEIIERVVKDFLKNRSLDQKPVIDNSKENLNDATQ